MSNDMEKAKPVIQSTWGTGKTKKTMAMHIKNQIYTKLGWEPGDLLLVTPDYVNKRLTLEKLKIRSTDYKENKK